MAKAKGKKAKTQKIFVVVGQTDLFNDVPIAASRSKDEAIANLDLDWETTPIVVIELTVPVKEEKYVPLVKVSV